MVEDPVGFSSWCVFECGKRRWIIEQSVEVLCVLETE